jgi:hypothetical protein
MTKGYKLNEIDDMDIHFYWELFDEESEKQEKVIEYADAVPWL